MSLSAAEAMLESKAEFFKALGHPVRLLILSLVQARSRHGEELAAILGLNPATISHHLSLLSAAGLLEARKDQYYQVYSLRAGLLEQPLADLLRLSPAGEAGQGRGVVEDAYRTKVLDTFFRYGRLLRLPAQLKKQQIVLERIAGAFESGREYSEREVNLILLDFHEDVAALRRGLVEQGLMAREKGFYSRKLS
jgi:ArsR family transcriptional regulator